MSLTVLRTVHLNPFWSTTHFYFSWTTFIDRPLYSRPFWFSLFFLFRDRPLLTLMTIQFVPLYPTDFALRTINFVNSGPLSQIVDFSHYWSSSNPMDCLPYTSCILCVTSYLLLDGCTDSHETLGVYTTWPEIGYFSWTGSRKHWNRMSFESLWISVMQGQSSFYYFFKPGGHKNHFFRACVYTRQNFSKVSGAFPG